MKHRTRRRSLWEPSCSGSYTLTPHCEACYYVASCVRYTISKTPTAQLPQFLSSRDSIIRALAEEKLKGG